ESYATEDGQRTELSDKNTRFSIREKDPPTETGIAYKVFYAKDGQLYPPMVANPNGAGTPVGVWLDADVGKSAPQSKTGRAQVQGGGKGTNAGKMSLAFRPGWHLGDIPLAKQFARKNPATGVKDLFPADFVWAECEYAKDVDYQEEAMSYGYTENGKFRHAYAGLPKVPTDGYYRYRTNPNPDTVPWVISGAMKVNKILTDKETDAICRKNGAEPMARQGGTLNLEKLGLGETTATKDGKTAAWSDKRIDRLYDAYASSSPNYAKAYAAFISPDDFLSLTTSNRGQIEAQSRPLDTKELEDERQEIQLTYDPETPGEVFGHEGRHRMVALKNAGVERVAIAIQFLGEAGKYDRKPIKSLPLRGEDFGRTRAPGNVTLEDLVPISQAYRAEIEEKFGKGTKADVRFSLKRTVESYASEIDDIRAELERLGGQSILKMQFEKIVEKMDTEKKLRQKISRIERKIWEMSQPPVDVSDPINTKNFKLWFGNWSNPTSRFSKVVDADGKPLVVYHGTGTTIEEFFPEFTGQGTDQYGSGFYFTTDKGTADGYTTRTLNGQDKPGGMENPNVIPVYLNIRKPLVVNASDTPNLYNIRVTPGKAAEIIRKAPDIMDPENSILGDYFEEFWDGGPKRYMIGRLANEYEWTIGTLETDIFNGHPSEFRQAVRDALGYDGVQINFENGEKHFVSWFPNQIKHATENSGAFSKKDNRIKFSLKADSEGKSLTVGQREYFKDSKVVDSSGQLRVMYSGGSDDFTVFDRKKSSYANLYGRGFYFTDSESHAKQYGNPRAYYLNIVNPVSTSKTTITRAQMRKFIQEVASNEDDFSFENYGYDATVDSVLKSVYGKSDFAMLCDVSQTAIGDMVSAVELFNEVNGSDF
ncbi:MAG: hypothetical protein RRY64_06310, partial [Oscillospiraceae bacterium]